MKNASIHALSLTFGTAFRASYWALGKDNFLTVRLLEGYKSLRRSLPGQTRGPGGRSTRYRSTEAYISTQEEI